MAWCGFVFWTAEAFAHDYWKNGDPVPAWVKAQCCGPQDVHELCPVGTKDTPAPPGCAPDDRYWEESDGFHIAGYHDGKVAVPYDKVLPSQDGFAWAFYKKQTDRDITNILNAGCGMYEHSKGACNAHPSQETLELYRWTPIYCLFVPTPT